MSQVVSYVGPFSPTTFDRGQVEGSLVGLGYKFVFRVHGWVECLVVGHGESWNGAGETEESALRDALHHMFPSEAARALLEGRASLAMVASALAEPESVVAPEVVVEAPPDPPIVKKPSVETEVVLVSASPVVSRPPPKPVPIVAVVEPLISVVEALDLLNVISAEIEDEAEDLAVTTSHLQRVFISMWIFRARSIQDQFPTNRLIEETVHRIAVRLTSLCKLFWPGSVRALTVDTTPHVAVASLTRAGVGSIQTWDQATEILEDVVERFAARTDTDEYGWRDLNRLSPSSPEPDVLLEEAVEKIEAVLGSLKKTLDVRSRHNSEDQIRGHVEELVHAGQLLRWIRRDVRDRLLWGTAFGALRWAAHTADLGLLRAVLDEDTIPTKSWAELLGRDPTINHKNRIKRELIATASVLGEDREPLVLWLRDAFPVFSNPQIAKMTQHARDLVLTLVNEDFAAADRTIRSRLRRLQTMLRTQEDISKVTLPKLEALADEQPHEESVPVHNPIEDLLRGKVRERTRGKRMLFVSNREDETLRVRLEEDLDCSVTLRDGSNSRKLQAIIASVTSSSYDMVLMATGFHDHSSDANLSRAAKAACVPYVRVNKGRPLATIRALARTFGFQESSQHAAPAS